MKSFSDYGIIVPSHKTSGNVKVVCPKCKERKGGGLTDKDLSVSISDGAWHCHSASCGWKGYLETTKIQNIKVEYKLPVWKNNTELSNKVVAWFESRGITQFTLRENKLSEGPEYMPQTRKEENTIQFNYFRDGILINTKYRDGQKNFKLVSGAELIFYNLDSIKDKKECIITEGEIDALSYWQIGFHNVVSVPNGASLGNNNFLYIDNCIDYFEDKEKIYIATDTDKAGINLRNELIRRFGAEKCFIVEYGEFKDANDLLKANGVEALRQTIENAKEIKVDGIFNTNDVFATMLHEFRHGKNRGSTTYIKTFDKCWTHRTGEVTMWTGYNNEGKSNMLSQLLVLKAQMEDWKFAIFCPENYPISDYYDDLIHCYVGKSCDLHYNNVMTENEYVEAASFINEHFFVIDPEDDYSIDTIIEKTKFLVKRKGIRALVIDPYNQIEHKMTNGQREDLYISKFMSNLKKQSIKLDIAIHLVAHQLTPFFNGKEDYPQPDQYKIKGGGTFSDKADNVVVVWRPFRKSNPSDTTVRIIVTKIKKQKLVGLPGEFDLHYSRAKNQYFEDQNVCWNEFLTNNKKNENIEIQTEFDWNNAKLEPNLVF